jgi:hypothetical protein
VETGHSNTVYNTATLSRKVGHLLRSDDNDDDDDNNNNKLIKIK